MHAVGPLIHQNCDRSVRSSVGNVLCHFFHDEPVADHKAHDFRRVEPGLPTQNRAMIEFHKHHQPRPAEASMDHTFQFSKGPCALSCLHELDHIRMPNGRFERRHDHLERLGRCHAEPFDLDPFDCHVFLPLFEYHNPTRIIDLLCLSRALETTSYHSSPPWLLPDGTPLDISPA